MKFLSFFAMISLFVTSITAAPERFSRVTPESQGIDSRWLLKCVRALDAEIDSVHSIMILRHGNVVAEGWWTPYAPEYNHVLFSLSKSFASTAIGIAAEEGKLDIHDPVLKYFPEDAPEELGWQIKQMRIKDLLTMSTGHETPPSANPDVLSAKSFLTSEIKLQPGTIFKYNTAATFMLSAIVEKQSGEKLVDYLKPRLFDPLGIENPVWDENFQGIALGGYGLRVRTEDIAALGQLYLQKGEWQGKRLLTREWVTDATSKQVSNGSNPDNDWSQGYGYQFWQCRHGAYRGDGAFGQFCIVFPEQEAVVAITSGTNDMGGIMNIIWDNFLPALHYVPIPENEKAVSALTKKLKSLKLPTPKGKKSSPAWKQVNGATFSFPVNDDKFESVSFKQKSKGQIQMSVRVDGRNSTLLSGFGTWLDSGDTDMDSEPAAGSFAWSDESTLVIRTAAYETPFVTTHTFSFKDDGTVKYDLKANAGFGGAKSVSLTGAQK